MAELSPLDNRTRGGVRSASRLCFWTRIPGFEPSFLRRLACLLLAAAVLRGVYWVQVLREPLLSEYWVLDADAFLREGARLVEGGGTPALDLSPLYSAIVALSLLVGGSRGDELLLVVQQLAGLLCAALIGELGRRLRDQWAGLSAAGLFAFYPASAMLETKLLPSAFGALLGASAIAVLITPAIQGHVRRYLVAGAAVGLAALLRPDQLLVLPLLALVVLLDGRTGGHRKGGASVAALLVGAVLVVAPVLVRNTVVSGEPVLISSQGGVTFYQGNNPRAEGTFSCPVGFSGNKATQSAEARALAEQAAGRELTHGEVDSHWYSQGLQFLLEDWSRALRLMGAKLWYWLGNLEMATEYTVPVENELAPATRLFCVPFAIILALGVLALPRLKSDHHVRIVMAFVVSNLATALLFFANSRFRVQALPAFAIMAGLGTSSLIEALRTCQVRVVPGLAALAVLGVSLSQPSGPLRVQSGTQWYNYGNEEFKRGHYSRAAQLYVRALQGRPQGVDIHFNLAQAKAQMEDWDGALSSMRRAVQLNPADREARQLCRQYASQTGSLEACGGP